MRRAKEKRDIRPRICTAPSRFLAINKNGDREQTQTCHRTCEHIIHRFPARRQDKKFTKSSLHLVNICTKLQDGYRPSCAQRKHAEKERVFRQKRCRFSADFSLQKACGVLSYIYCCPALSCRITGRVPIAPFHQAAAQPEGTKIIFSKGENEHDP